MFLKHWIKTNTPLKRGFESLFGFSAALRELENSFFDVMNRLNVRKTMKLLTQFDGSYTQVPQVKQVEEFSERVSESVLKKIWFEWRFKKIKY